MQLRVTCMIIIGVLVLPFALGGPALAEDLLLKSCQELVRLAQNYQTDLKTVDTVLGSAIEAGNMDRIRNYQLKKNAVRKQLDSVLRAVDLRGCVIQR
ncbi:MAG TPA: hypothetical protein VK463_14685 [Desulfomonilaceae bacterium]|nr:hypothetical protein [Desulfomonilaceae bacterium]